MSSNPSLSLKPSGLKSLAAERLDQWTKKRQGLDRERVQITRRRLYILPSKRGYLFAILALTIIAGSMNYNNSLGLALGFVLVSISIIAMHRCHRNLSQLKLKYMGQDATFAGQPLVTRWSIENDASYDRYGLMLESSAGHMTTAIHVEAGNEILAERIQDTHKRGYHPIGRFRVSTTFPLGLFRAWTWVYSDLNTVIFPAPIEKSKPVNSLMAEAGRESSPRRGHHDFAGLREYHPGDQPKRIAWRVLARSDQLAVKQFEGGRASHLWFDWEATSGENELRISTLTRWIIDAEERGQQYGLRLPSETLKPDHGLAHRNRCLSVLALQ